MLKIKNAIQWFPGVEAPGIFRMPQHTVTDQRRGITFDRPEGFYGDTVYGRQQLTPGAWLLTCESGNTYVVRSEDYSTSFKVSFMQKLRELFR